MWRSRNSHSFIDGEKYKTVQLLWKIVWQFLTMPNIVIPYNQVIVTLEICLNELKIISIRGAWLAQSVEHVTLHLRVASSSTMFCAKLTLKKRKSYVYTKLNTNTYSNFLTAKNQKQSKCPLIGNRLVHPYDGIIINQQ